MGAVAPACQHGRKDTAPARDSGVALYEPDAVLAFPPGQLTTGTQAIRKVYEQLLATNPSFQGTPQPAIVNGDLALTSTRIPSGATVEIARRQPDGTWRWLVDQPRILS